MDNNFHKRIVKNLHFGANTPVSSPEIYVEAEEADKDKSHDGYRVLSRNDYNTLLTSIEALFKNPHALYYFEEREKCVLLSPSIAAKVAKVTEDELRRAIKRAQIRTKPVKCGRKTNFVRAHDLLDWLDDGKP